MRTLIPFINKLHKKNIYSKDYLCCNDSGCNNTKLKDMNMNSKYIASLIIALSCSYPLFSVANAASTPVSRDQSHAEGKILDALIVLNKNEISAGQLAAKKSSNQEVINFADLMIKAHSDNLKEAEHLGNKLGIRPMEGKVAHKLKHKGKAELAHLKKLSGKSFDKAYINAMVKGHMNALELINNLEQKTANRMIKKYLENTKKHVMHHLEKAKAIQKTLG